MHKAVLKKRYQLVDSIGSRGTRETYIARDLSNVQESRCIVKRLNIDSHPNTDEIATLKRLFDREAQVLEVLGSHDKIPSLIDYFEYKNSLYLVLEFIEGQTLLEELSDVGNFLEEETIELLEDVLSILKFIHSKGTIHRDIKPSNLIKRERDGKLVLVDFGAVKSIQNLIPDVDSSPSPTIIGTPGYMPPEQVIGMPQPNSDIYALGRLAIQALTGTQPDGLEGSLNGELLWEPPVDTNQILVGIINKMVRFQYKERYQSVDEVILEIDDLHRLNSAKEISIESSIVSVSDSPKKLSEKSIELKKRELEIRKLESQLELSIKRQEIELEEIRNRVKYGVRQQNQLYYVKLLTSVVLVLSGILFAQQDNNLGGFMIGSGTAGIGITVKTSNIPDIDD